MKKIALVSAVIGLSVILNPSKVFAWGEDVVLDGVEKVSECIRDDFKPENRQKARSNVYYREVSSYSAEESARKGSSYWAEKQAKEKKLFDDMSKDHSASDEKNHSIYDKIHKVLFGTPVDVKMKKN